MSFTWTTFHSCLILLRGISGETRFFGRMIEDNDLNGHPCHSKTPQLSENTLQPLKIMYFIYVLSIA